MASMKLRSIGCVLCVVIATAGCGGKSKGAGSGGGGDGDVGDPVPEGPLTPGAWDGMSPQQRGTFMKKTVLPAMAGVFLEFDGAEFANMNCKTCHGQGADDGTFKMPNPGLPQLCGDQIMSPDAEHAAITEFMKNEVRPTMATLLGKPEWSPEQPDGFGCFGCHEMAH